MDSAKVGSGTYGETRMTITVSPAEMLIGLMTHTADCFRCDKETTLKELTPVFGSALEFNPRRLCRDGSRLFIEDVKRAAKEGAQMSTAKETVEALRAAFDVACILHEAIHAAGKDGVPSGHVYAQVMSTLTLDCYERLICVLVNAGCVEMKPNFILISLRDPMQASKEGPKEGPTDGTPTAR